MKRFKSRIAICLMSVVAMVFALTLFARGEVQAAAVGKVKSIETTAQTGTTITMDIGSGYEVVYGQLKEVCVEKGQHVSQGECIGYVSEPTKYYNVEGPNLYFQVLKDGDPVNPLEYLEA